MPEAPTHAKTVAKVDHGQFMLALCRLTFPRLRMHRLLFGFKDSHELLITTRDLIDRSVAANLAGAPVHEWIPETGAADRETNKSRYGCGGGQPKLDLAVVLASSQNDAPDLIAAVRACGGHDAFAVPVGIEPLDFPDVRLHSRSLQFLDRLNHQSRTELKIIRPVTSINTIKLRFFGRNQQLEHKAGTTVCIAQMGRQLLQTSCLPAVQVLIAFRVVA